jgi:hypothetical protein
MQLAHVRRPTGDCPLACLSSTLCVSLRLACSRRAAAQCQREAASVEFDVAIDNPLKLEQHFHTRRCANAQCCAK